MVTHQEKGKKMSKIYKYTVYVEDMDEFGSTNWEIEIEENIGNSSKMSLKPKPRSSKRHT